MSSISVPRVTRRAAVWFSTAQYRTRARFSRYALAWRYLHHSLSCDDARGMIWELQDRAEYQILETLDLESTLESARDRWGDIPELPKLCARAIARVGSKWESTGDAASAAEDWALDLIPDYAEQDGITLVDLYEIDPDDAA